MNQQWVARDISRVGGHIFLKVVDWKIREVEGVCVCVWERGGWEVGC